ncbi:MAG: polysaccharide deacetylase family protein [Lachnospiraceae bacterium]|nr:polysaccharide deacetylase family protein [Lachnospiraceae bacterium]
MKRKRKRMSTITRVLLCSWCVLVLVLAFFIVNWAMNLSADRDFTDADNIPVSSDGGRVTGKVTSPATEDKPTATPEPIPEVSFSTEYVHRDEPIEERSYTSRTACGLRYPKLDGAAGKAVGQVAHDMLEETLTELVRGGGVERKIVIDYEDGETAGLVSVLFYIVKERNGQKETETRQWIYNKKKDEVVDAASLFADRAYLYIAQQVNDAEGVTSFTGTREEFGEYLLTADGARFYYELDGTRRSVDIPYIALHTYMAVTVNGTVIAERIRELDPEKPMIAFTFDDGPHYQQTPRLLEILEKNDARATFFVLGDRAFNTESNKKTVTMVYDSGNEVASHTYSHKDLKTLSVEQLTEEITKARDNLFALTGEYPTFLRPPYGNYNDDVKAYCYAPLITWNLDSEDWKSRDTDTIVAQVMEKAKDGRIVLMHDIHWFTVDAVEILLPKLKEMGYQIVTIRELFYYQGLELENGKVYFGGFY